MEGEGLDIRAGVGSAFGDLWLKKAEKDVWDFAGMRKKIPAKR